MINEDEQSKTIMERWIKKDITIVQHILAEFDDFGSRLKMREEFFCTLGSNPGVAEKLLGEICRRNFNGTSKAGFAGVFTGAAARALYPIRVGHGRKSHPAAEIVDWILEWMSA